MKWKHKSQKGMKNIRSGKYMDKPKTIFFFFKTLKKFIRGWLMYKVVLVSHVQQNASAIHIHISVLFHILSSYRLLQNIE